MTGPAAWPAGYHIGDRAPGPTAEQLGALRGLPVTIVSDCLGRTSGAVGLQRFHADSGERMCGPALTVRVRPGDNLMIHKALLLAQPGDILVIDGGGDESRALLGGLMRTTAVAAQLGGIVVDGVIRDVEEWTEPGLPTFARGACHRGPFKEGPGEINVPVDCAGMLVSPGDVVLGDADGVVSVPVDRLTSVATASAALLEHEDRVREQNRTGDVNAERIDGMLRAKGLPL